MEEKPKKYDPRSLGNAISTDQKISPVPLPMRGSEIPPLRFIIGGQAVSLHLCLLFCFTVICLSNFSHYFFSVSFCIFINSLRIFLIMFKIISRSSDWRKKKRVKPTFKWPKVFLSYWGKKVLDWPFTEEFLQNQQPKRTLAKSFVS